jgi:hypothetical protein
MIDSDSSSSVEQLVSMRGQSRDQGRLFSYVRPEERIPPGGVDLEQSVELLNRVQ